MMACDIRIVDETAIFGLSEVSLGISPGAGGAQNLTRLVGAGMAKLMVLSGERIDAAEAKAIGLIDRFVPSGTVLEAALVLAQRINAMAPWPSPQRSTQSISAQTCRWQTRSVWRRSYLATCSVLTMFQRA